MDNVPPPANAGQVPLPADNDQDAASSWPRTIRYCVIITAERATLVIAVWLPGHWHH